MTTLNPILKKGIDTKFTATVAEYIANGYIFVTSAMNTSYGAFEGSATLTKGKHTVVIYLTKSRKLAPEAIKGDLADCFSLVIADAKLGGWGDCDIVDGTEKVLGQWYRHWNARGVFYATIEEMKTARKISLDRSKSNYESDEQPELNTDEAKRKILAILNKREGFKSLKLRDLNNISLRKDEKRKNGYGPKYRCFTLWFNKKASRHYVELMTHVIVD